MYKKTIVGKTYCSTNVFKLLKFYQLNNGIKKFNEQLKDNVSQMAIMGGNVVGIKDGKKVYAFETNVAGKKFRETYGSTNSKNKVFPIGLIERINVVGTGMRVFLRLANSGIYPGFGGYLLTPDNYKTTPQKRLDSVISKKEINVLQKSIHDITPEEEEFLRKAALEVGVFIGPTKSEKGKDHAETTTKKTVYKPILPIDYKYPEKAGTATISDSRERAVPSSRAMRLANFGKLAVGLSTGAAFERAKRAISQPTESSNTNVWLNSVNVERIVETLCRMRGAALKLGQMLSIQDEETVPRYILDIFERVRQSADFMPYRQVNKQMSHELGTDWIKKFKHFEKKPFAAASIGQVHEAILHSGLHVAVKIQYPGVAKGIDSDIDNLLTVLKIGGILPKGMFLENFASVARRELRMECDYVYEANSMIKFKELVKGDDNFYVPTVIPELSSKQVLSAEFVVGTSVDNCYSEPQAVRDYIATKYIELCLKEIFVWRLMQTDPNWSNFLFGKHPVTNGPTIFLLDFGATRSYDKLFVDKYMRIIRAAYEDDRENMLKWSREIGFLSGYESKLMNDAHCDSIAILGECLTSKGPFDFSKQSVTKRINNLVPVMLKHRLKAPPDEIYSLHRKLSGSFLLASKLRATVSCGALFDEIYKKYKFSDSEVNNTL